jgi:hypothetical protein
MKPSVKHNKTNVDFNHIAHIKIFAQLNAPKRFFTDFWSGAYKGIIQSTVETTEPVFPLDKAPKVGSTSWVGNKFAENSAYILAKMYRQINDDNKLLQRDLTTIELIELTVAFNIKYGQSTANSLGISQVASLFSSLQAMMVETGVAIFKCACSNEYVARSTAAPKTCPWCRMQIKKLPKGITASKPFKVDILKLSKVLPKNESLTPSFS